MGGRVTVRIRGGRGIAEDDAFKNFTDDYNRVIKEATDEEKQTFREALNKASEDGEFGDNVLESKFMAKSCWVDLSEDEQK